MSLFERLFGKPSKHGAITSFENVTLHTSGMRAALTYKIVMNGDKAEILQYDGFRSEDEDRGPSKRAECSEARILKLLNDCRVFGWDGFYGKHPKHVRDGTTFRFEAFVNGCKRISASGSQNFPKHYGEFTEGIRVILSDPGET
ncbi:MAG: hypothetical protein IKX06_03350 [Clostridia bacterium]|nr:hypothetical protein [Clostridia bacterium]